MFMEILILEEHYIDIIMDHQFIGPSVGSDGYPEFQVSFLKQPPMPLTGVSVFP